MESFMKKYFLAFSVLVSASSSFAGPTCFNFINGKGPSRIGNVPLAAPAASVCVSSHNIRFFDSQGDLAIMEADVTATGRCGAGLCKELALSYGNANGDNVDFTGVEVVIQAEADTHLGVSKGTLTIKAGRDFPQKYLIIDVQ